MRTFRVDADHPDDTAIQAAGEAIRSGGTVAFPTETVYGLGANALDPQAVLRIFAAKERPSFNPLIVHCADLEAAKALASEWPEAAERLARAYWPGPLTLVVRKRSKVPDVVTAGLPTVGLRVPSHPVAAALLEAADTPIAAPSANRFTRLSPTRAEHVSKGLAGRVDILLDGGPSGVGVESTVVDVSGEEPVLLRPGSIDSLRLEHTLGVPLRLPGVYASGESRPGPGMMDRHYSPVARLVLLPHGDRAALREAARKARASSLRVGALLMGLSSDEAIDSALQMPTEAAGYARELYHALHRLDDLGLDEVLVEAPPEGPQWAAVLDRLRRAAARL